MHPEIERELAKQRIDDLRHDGRAGGRVRASHAVKVKVDREVVLRGARVADGPALRALAALDGALPPVGPALVAEAEGAILAVMPLDGGRPYADPFRHTDDLVALLEARAEQLDAARRTPGRRSRLGWLAPQALRRLV